MDEISCQLVQTWTSSDIEKIIYVFHAFVDINWAQACKPEMKHTTSENIAATLVKTLTTTKSVDHVKTVTNANTITTTKSVGHLKTVSSVKNVAISY